MPPFALPSCIILSCADSLSSRVLGGAMAQPAVNTITTNARVNAECMETSGSPAVSFIGGQLYYDDAEGENINKLLQCFSNLTGENQTSLCTNTLVFAENQLSLHPIEGFRPSRQLLSQPLPRSP